MKAPHEPFETLLDRARSHELSTPERRRLEMVLRSNHDAELEWWLLSDFTYEQMEHAQDEDRTDRAVDRALRVLGLAAPELEDPSAPPAAEPELARTEPTPPPSTEVRGHPATSATTARALLAIKGQLGNKISMMALVVSAALGAGGMAAASHVGAAETASVETAADPNDLRDLPVRVEFHRTPRATLNSPSGRQVLDASRDSQDLEATSAPRSSQRSEPAH